MGRSEQILFRDDEVPSRIMDDLNTRRSNAERDKLLKLIIKYLYDCQTKTHAHAAAERVNRKRERVSSWTQSILSLVVGVTGVSAWNNVDECGNSNNLSLIIVGVVLSFTAASIGATRSAWKFASKEQWHHTCVGNFADVASDIEYFLTGDLEDVRELKAFADMIHEKMDIHTGSESPIGIKYMDRAKETISYPKNGLYNPLKSGVISRPDAILPELVEIDIEEEKEEALQ